MSNEKKPQQTQEDALRGAMRVLLEWEAQMQALSEKPHEELSEVDQWLLREYKRANSGEVDERFVVDGREVFEPLHHT